MFLAIPFAKDAAGYVMSVGHVLDTVHHPLSSQPQSVSVPHALPKHSSSAVHVSVVHALTPQWSTAQVSVSHASLSHPLKEIHTFVPQLLALAQSCSRFVVTHVLPGEQVLAMVHEFVVQLFDCVQVFGAHTFEAHVLFKHDFGP